MSNRRLPLGGEADRPSGAAEPGSAKPAPAAQPQPRAAGKFFGSLAARLERLINPILLRSMRQGLRSRAFLGVYGLVLVVATVVAAITSLKGDFQPGAPAGHDLFIASVLAWTFAAWVVQPLLALASVGRERHEYTWDLVELTGMRPRTVVHGLLGTSLVQAAMIGSALAPFLVLSFLIRGVDLREVGLALVLLPSGTLVLTSAAIFVGTLGGSRATRSVLGLLSSLGLLLLLGGISTFWLEGAPEVIDSLREPGAWLFLGSIATGIVVSIWLFSTLAATLLTHPAQDRSTAARLAVGLVWLAWILWIAGLYAWVRYWRNDPSLV